MKYNIDNRLKDTAIVNLTDFLNVIDLYEDDETEKALELCIGLITLGLGGTFETDDREIKRLLRNRQYTVSKSNTAYCNKVNSDELKQKNKLQLDDIAEMMANGATQQIIADTLCVSLDTIKYRVRVMKENYPELYAQSVAPVQTEGVKKCKKVGVSGMNDNVKDNVKENENENENENNENDKLFSCEKSVGALADAERAGVSPAFVSDKDVFEEFDIPVFGGKSDWEYLKSVSSPVSMGDALGF